MLWKISELLSIREKEEVTPRVILLMKSILVLASVVWEKMSWAESCCFSVGNKLSVFVFNYVPAIITEGPI